jgi:hypothetical protein
MATSGPTPVDFFTGESVPAEPQQGQFDPRRAVEFVNAVTSANAEQAQAEALALGRAQALDRFGGENTTAFGPSAVRVFIQSNKDPGQPGFNNPRIPLRLSYIATATVRASPTVLPDPVPVPPPPPPPQPEAQPSQLNVDPFDVPEIETLIEPPDFGPPVTEPVPVDPGIQEGIVVTIPVIEPEPVPVDDPADNFVPVEPNPIFEPAPVDDPADNFVPQEPDPTDNFVPVEPDPTATRTVAGKVDTIYQPPTASLTKQPETGDWRLKISLASNANYLYKDPAIQNVSGGRASILYPLTLTDGVLFPYTPDITTAYRADYDNYSLTHSNYRGYFYKSSFVDAVNITADFTAQDTYEANYMLAMIHFFRSVTKMFYGRDQQAGAPPPMVYMIGLGQFQYANHPCLVSQFNYSLPNNVDYVRAGSVTNLQQNLLTQRPRASIATNPISNAVNRLRNAFGGNLPIGGQQQVPQPPTLSQPGVTYVPTKLSVQLTLLPVQTRGQVSNRFNVQDYASGALLRQGYW